MTPIKFQGADQYFGPPQGWGRDEPCDGLWTKIEDGVCVSCWEPTWTDRFRLVFGKPVWLHVVGRQVPVMLMTE